MLGIFPPTPIIWKTVDTVWTSIEASNGMTLIIKSTVMAKRRWDRAFRAIFMRMAWIVDGIIRGYDTAGSNGTAVPAPYGMAFIVFWTPVARPWYFGARGTVLIRAALVIRCLVFTPWPLKKWSTGQFIGAIMTVNSNNRSVVCGGNDITISKIPRIRQIVFPGVNWIVLLVGIGDYCFSTFRRAETIWLWNYDLQNA
jgi:hypothetical protein